MTHRPDLRQLKFLLASVGISVTGDGVMLAAAPLLAASLTTDPLGVALTSACGSIAWVVMGMPAGALVDRMPLRLTMITVDLLRAAVLVGMGILVLTGRITLGWLLAGLFLVGVGACFFDPAAQATVPVLVSRRRPALHRANGYLWSIDTLARSLAGPPLGAALFQAARILPFVADALSFMASAALVSRLPAQDFAPVEPVPFLASIRDGLRFAVSDPKLRALAIGLGIYNVGWNTAMATFVLFSVHELHVGTTGYGLLLACSALGAVVSGWSAPALMRRIDTGQAFSAVLVLQAASWGAVFFCTRVWQVAFALLVVGASTNLVSIVGGSARQYLSPPHLIGRIIAATRLLGIGGSAVGAITGGLLARAFAVRAPFAAAAGILVVGALLIWLPLHAPHLRHD